ncbi:Predicted small secreted protein [Lampropedia hyalina DSM 16112]|uniref:Predicted small secreted protein n=1 Tax=Lampropedia hyalina DSM 16112 TaxID=1122156 RepID=A0A1M4XSR5_9BURK|nr:entericidin A/B family lipoprotein [Lampropedia hyalina]SHE96624.1 Predicted small secreted protein [Lampropedia hyalina DSM 16112]
MKKHLTSVVSAVALALAALAVSGCNTVQGVGKDVQKAGGAIERAAK